MESAELDILIQKMLAEGEENAFKYSDQLGRIGGEELIQKMIDLLMIDAYDTKFLAARTLGLIKDKQSSLDALMEAILDKRNQAQNGAMVDILETYDLSENFVDVLRIYLTGGFKVSAVAKELLDYTEFNITPRVIRKAEKHWNHYLHNTKKDEVFEIRKTEVETILNELKGLFNEDEMKNDKE